MFANGSGAVENCLDERLDLVEKQIRRKMYRCGKNDDVKTESMKLWCTETFDIHGDELVLEFYR